ncbi:competence type IV pilus assembly protein ComGB [Bacillaceae bacterium IKA-2]|nr:competence type IV pilus assembly protein ComGB [Bacillaceae bacterium IKA-2]
MKQKGGWSNLKKAEFLIRIGGLLKQGYTISESMELFLKYEKERVKPLLNYLLKDLKKGQTFSDALAVFQLPSNIISFVYFSEQYGNLAKGLIDSGQLLKKEEENKQKLQKLIKYPILLIWMLLFFIIIMYQFVFPQFQLLFATINADLPIVTKVLLLFIEQFSVSILIIVFLLVSIFFLYYALIFRKKDIVFKANTISKIPLVGNYYQTMLTYFFATNLSCLIKSGMAIYGALTIFKEREKLGYMSEAAKRLISKLEEGETLHDTLLADTLYLEGLAYIVEHGQSNGRLDQELDYYSNWLLIEFEEKLMKLMMVIQPVLFLIIGLIILLMFASLLLPIFSIMSGL